MLTWHIAQSHFLAIVTWRVISPTVNVLLFLLLVVLSIGFLTLIKIYKNNTTMAQKLIIKTVGTQIFCSSRWPVNSYMDICFIIVTYGQNAFWTTGEFLAAITQLATGKQLCKSVSYTKSKSTQIIIIVCY